MINSYDYDEISLRLDVSKKIQDGYKYADINVSNFIDWALNHSEVNNFLNLRAPAVELWRIIHSIGWFYANTFYTDDIGKIPGYSLGIGYF